MDEKVILSASQIRFLLAMYENRVHGGVRNRSVVNALNLSRASVHNMMETMVRLGMIHKDTYGAAYFTDLGTETAERYSAQYKKVSTALAKVFPNLENLNAVSCTLISEISDSVIDALPEE